MVKYRREQQTQDFKEFKKFKKRKSLVSPRIEKKDLELKSQDQINQLAQESFDRGFTQGLNKAKKIYSNREKTLKIYESKMKQRLLNYATQVASEKKFEIENSQPKDEKKWH